MSNFFNRWSGAGGGAGRGTQPPRRPLGLGAAPRQGVSFEDEREYDLADDGRDYFMPTGRGPPPTRGQPLPPAEYEARRNAIFSTGSGDDYQDAGAGGGHTMPAPARGGRGFESLPHQGSFGSRDATARGSGAPSVAPTPLLPPQPQEGGAQINVQPPANQGGAGTGGAHTPAGSGPVNTPPQEFSGIASALDRLAPLLSDADTARNLRWQREVNGDNTKLPRWRLEATGSSGLQFYAYM